MVNIATIALTHAIMLLAAWRLMLRDDLDRDPPVAQDAHKPDDKDTGRRA